MEALNHMLTRAKSGGFITSFKLGRRDGEGLEVSHQLFADGTLIFCDANPNQFEIFELSVYVVEVISDLKINLEKSKIIPIGGVANVEDLVLVLGYKIGKWPTSYLDFPLGALFKPSRVWDVVKERFRKRLAMWKRQFVSKGGKFTLVESIVSSPLIYFMSLFVIPIKVNLRLEKIQIDFLRGDGALEKRPHLFNWNLVHLGKKDGGLKICNLYVLNKALLGKWNLKFVTESDPLWKQIIIRKSGDEDKGWCSRGVRGGYTVGV